jgi:hypothetical protein
MTPWVLPDLWLTVSDLPLFSLPFLPLPLSLTLPLSLPLFLYATTNLGGIAYSASGNGGLSLEQGRQDSR